MRMHRKNNLDARLAACGEKFTPADLSVKDMRAAVRLKEYIDFRSAFENDNPVRLEIGCGKGGFVCQTAKNNPQVNFIACERISNVLIVGLEQAVREQIPNVHFINCPAQVLGKYLPPDSVERIYLNFSDPLLKEGYKKQRLTHPALLESYKNFLKAGGEIHQKTDNAVLFEFSLESYKAAGYEIITCSEDWKSEEKGEAATEYELHFRSQGKNIYRLTARRTK